MRYARLYWLGVDLFDGEGAYRFGGCWNSPGQRLVYAIGQPQPFTLDARLE